MRAEDAGEHSLVPRFPLHVRIIDPRNHPYAQGYRMTAPPASVPHLGKSGLIRSSWKPGDSPKIELEDGTVLYGYECWWVEEPSQPAN